MTAKLILSDIDDTIMPRGTYQVPERTRNAFLSAIDAGNYAGVVSGRAFEQLPPFFNNDERCIATGITTNGLTIYVGGECVLKYTVSPELLARLMDAVDQLPNAGVMYFDGANPVILRGKAEDLLANFPAYAKSASYGSLPDEPVVKCNAFIRGGFDEAQVMADFLSEAVPELDFDVPNPGYNNIMAKGVNKGSSVLWLANYLGIAPEDIFVFGDADNDLTMMRAVKNSVAVANATPNAAATAHWHIGACKDDAVAGAIEALVAGEFPFSE